MLSRAPLVLMTLLIASSGHGADLNAQGLPLTNAQQVLSLSHVEARQLRPVKLKGVVTFYAPERGWFWLQDSTAAVLIAPDPAIKVAEGQTVEVEGATDSGLFTPWVVKARVRVTGAAPLPAPIRASPLRMAAGEHHGHRVEVEGTIRDLARSYQNLVLLASSRQTRFRIIVNDQAGFPSLPADWLDARVRVQGLCWTDYDTAGHPGGFSMRLSSTNAIQLLSPGNSNLFDRLLHTAVSLPTLGNETEARIRLQGSVIARLPGGTIFLRDSSGALEAKPLLPLPRTDLAGLHLDFPPALAVVPGDQLELVGAPRPGGGSPQLHDALYRVIGKTNPPAPVASRANALLAGHRACELVTIRGRILHHESRPTGRFLHEVLLIEDGNARFEAVLETDKSGNQLSVQPDNLVELTGMAATSTEGINRRTLRLWLRDKSDVRVVGQWSQPTPRAFGKIAMGLAVVGLAGGGTIALLRRRLRVQGQLMARLAESENRFRLLFERFNDPIMLLDLKTFTFIDCNQAAVDQMRCGSKERFCSRSPWEISPEKQPDGASSREKAESMIARIHEKGSARFEWMHQRADGSEFPVEVSLTAIQIGERPLLVAIWRDITERKQAEEEIRRLNQGLERRVVERTAELRESEARFRTMVEHAPEAIGIFDADKNSLVEPNENMLRLFDCTREELARLSPAQLSPATQPDGRPSAKASREWVQAALAGQVPVFEWVHRNLRGENIPCEVRLVRLPSPDRRLLRASVTNITARKRVEAEMRKALAHEKELNELKTSFVSMVSHEFRTPLGIILVASEILQRYFDRLAPEERTDHLRDIATSVKRMAGMMEDVLLLSRVEAGRVAAHPSELNLRLFCGRIIDEVHSATNRAGTIRWQCDDSVPAAGLGDENLVRHILTNLLSNAVKYSPPGKPVELTLCREGTDAVLEVTDHGIGIPPADQERLFQTFHRGRNVGQIPGTGLGLVIVKRCCDLHGGNIAVSSREGHGTTFTVRLPMFDASQ
jgi:PAS domain S-box-containing protein